jgi:hypothetical protein
VVFQVGSGFKADGRQDEPSHTLVKSYMKALLIL